MTISNFHFRYFDDINLLKKWFLKPQHYQQLEHIKEPISHVLYREKWQVHAMEIVDFLHKKIFSVALKHIKIFLEHLGSHILSMKVVFLHLHLSCYSNHLHAYKSYGRYLLCFARNYPKQFPKTSHIEKKIAPKDMKDAFVKDLFHPSSYDESITLFHLNGVCRGMCFWFIYLYLSSKKQFNDTNEHILSVAKEFEEGAPLAASILQNVWKIESFLGLKGNIISISYDEFEKNKDRFRKFPHGIYSIGFGKHRINYVKISSSESYFFDPNIGTWKIKNSASDRAHHHICNLATFYSLSNEQPRLVISYFSSVLLNN
jgi:hypothetical protein